jgi:hypothetical protein
MAFEGSGGGVAGESGEGGGVGVAGVLGVDGVEGTGDGWVDAVVCGGEEMKIGEG